MVLPELRLRLDDRDNVPYLTNKSEVVAGRCFYPGKEGKHAAAATAEIITANDNQREDDEAENGKN